MSIYSKYTPEQLENHFSNFLISSWSYSKVAEFTRNEKAFEMTNIYRQYGKKSSTTIAGEAYHQALDGYFKAFKLGNRIDLPQCEVIAFEYIKERPAYIWKCQKTTPFVEDCIQKANKTVTALLRNFFAEIGLYINEIKEIIEVEVYCNEFLTVNGVDIPLPCHAKIDLVFLSKDDKIVIVDHKSKNAYSSEEELKLSIGKQAITYINCYEQKTGQNIDEVWFIENKYSQNKDGAQQLSPFKLTVTNDVRRLYEALLYEPLKRMITAVNDPDYVYMINDSDNYVDKSEIYSFWAKTMISEVEDFNVDPTKKELVSKRLRKIRDASLVSINPKIIKEFNKNASEFIQYDFSNKDMTPQEKIEHVLRTFGITTRVEHRFDGYSSNTYLLAVGAGTKISSIHSHKLDIANVLDVSTVRISKDLVVNEGKSFVGVEFSKKRDRDLIFDPTELNGMKIPIGKDNFGNTVIWDLENHSTPHMLICGATGSGKSVSIRSTIEYAKLAGVEKVVIFDPKYEFMNYAGSDIEVYNEISAIEQEIKNLVDEMNELVRSGKHKKILVIFDEFADAVTQGRSGKELDIMEMVEVGQYAPKKGAFGIMMPGAPKMALKKVGEHKSLQENLRILLQKGRSTGFRIIAATQRASVQVITGDAKVNFPVQICFRVPKETDSRVVIDEAGAESLAGMGDGLIKSPEYPDVVRFQAYYKP